MVEFPVMGFRGQNLDDPVLSAKAEGIGARGRILRLALPAAVGLHLLAALGYGLVTPLFDRPDEVAHYNNIRHLAEHGRLDVMTGLSWDPVRLEKLKSRHFLSVEGPDDPAIAGIRYQAWQPPLYYAAAAAMHRLTGGNLGALRVLSLLFSCATLGLAHRIARTLYPARPDLAAAAVLFLALHPMRAYMATAIHNDPASECLFALGLWTILARRPAWQTGLAAGAGLLTKAHLGALLPLYAVWIGSDPRRGPTWRERVRTPAPYRDLVTASGICLLVAWPWILRNMALYGWADPLALRAGALGSGAAELAAFGRARPALAWTGPYGLAAFFRILLISWWGVYGWMSMWPPRAVLWAYGALTLLPVAGGIRAWRRPSSPGGAASESVRAARWLALSPLVFLAALLIYSLSDFQPQGRYLLTAGPVWALGFALGWDSLPPAIRRPAAAGSLALLALIHVKAVGSVIPWYLAQAGG